MASLAAFLRIPGGPKLSALHLCISGSSSTVAGTRLPEQLEVLLAGERRYRGSCSKCVSVTRCKPSDVEARVESMSHEAHRLTKFCQPAFPALAACTYHHVFNGSCRRVDVNVYMQLHRR